ncbi:MAG TPA: nuclear transport factor 2 family protein [Thermoleophilaceae bacterium]|nr:nuclear transport factor 2 family protein [Thermoleophilaceae bacterium]
MASKEAQSSQREAEVAREAAAAFGSAFTNGEIDAFLTFLAADVDFEVPSVMQDTVKKLTGHDEVRGYLEQTASAYEELRVESREIRDFGGCRFLMVGSWQAKPRTSTTRFGTPMGAVLDMRDGKVTRLRAFFDEQLAIDAAGRD